MGFPLFCVGPWEDLSALLVVTHTHTQSLRTILLRFRGSLDTCHPHCSAGTCAPGCQESQLYHRGLSPHEPLDPGALTAQVLVRGPCVSLPFEREPVGEAAQEAYVSFSGCDSSQFILPNLSLGSRRQQTCSTGGRVSSPFTRKLCMGAAESRDGRHLGVSALFCSGSRSFCKCRLNHGIFVHPTSVGLSQQMEMR